MTEAAKNKIGEMRVLMPKLGEVVEQGKVALAAGTKEQDVIARELLMKQMPPLAGKMTELTKELTALIPIPINSYAMHKQL